MIRISRPGAKVKPTEGGKTTHALKPEPPKVTRATK